MHTMLMNNKMTLLAAVAVIGMAMNPIAAWAITIVLEKSEKCTVPKGIDAEVTGKTKVHVNADGSMTITCTGGKAKVVYDAVD